MPRRLRPEVEVEISSYSSKGLGVGEFERQDGSKGEVEVPCTCPGDQVRVQLLRRRKGIYQCFFQEMVKPSEQRVEPKCPHFASCGGCKWQHIPYEEQLRIKEERVRALLQPLADEQVVWHPIIGLEEPWRYRNKMEFSFSQNKEGRRFLGLMMLAGKGRVVDLHECSISPEWMSTALEAARGWWEDTGLAAYHPPSDNGTLRNLTLREGRASGDRMAVLLVSGNPDFAPTRSQLDAFVEVIQKAVPPTREGAELSIFLRVQQIQKGQPTQFYEMHLAGPTHIRENLKVDDGRGHAKRFTFRISPAAFFQPNSQQAERLYSRAMQLLEIHEDASVYDLYCGTGTLAMFAAKFAKSVVGVELSAESALDARENAIHNELDNVSIITGDVGKVLEDKMSSPDFVAPEVVMVDPPRAGLTPKALKHLVQLNAEKILYISCNPKTQAENIEELVKEGYRIDQIQPVDQFPQTIHIENIVILRRTLEAEQS